MLDYNSVKAILERYYDCKNLNISIEPQTGGDIHQSYLVTLNIDNDIINNKIPEKIFLKTNSKIGADVLESEFDSLNTIAKQLPRLYPNVILYERIDDQGLLFMSFHHLSTIRTTHATEAGQALAKHHKIKNDKFGWHTDNYIGLTPQPNRWHSNWVTFFREHRLIPMLLKAVDQGLNKKQFEQINHVIENLDELLNHHVIPSLVHGDLWSGNIGFDEIQQQTLFYDPAPYFGDREVDLAMTQLFGIQPDSFYQAYQQRWPLAKGYEKRLPIYNLYHALNHVILFGPSYFNLIENCLYQIKISND